MGKPGDTVAESHDVLMVSASVTMTTLLEEFIQHDALNADWLI